MPDLALGGWANPHGDPATQVGHLLDEHATAEFYLTQIVSHHSRDASSAFSKRRNARQLELPGMFGVFYYRSANPKTLAALSSFLPVPVEELTEEFAAGAIARRSLRAIDAGARGRRRAALLHQQPAARPRGVTLRQILERAELTAKPVKAGD